MAKQVVLKIESDLRKLTYIIYSNFDKIGKYLHQAKLNVYSSLYNLDRDLYLMRADSTRFIYWGQTFKLDLHLLQINLRLIFDLEKNNKNFLNKNEISNIIDLVGGIQSQIIGWISSGIKEEQKL